MDPSAQMLQAAHRLVHSGKPREAELYYRKILLRNPNHAEALNALGVALSDLHKFREAERCLARASQLAPAAPEPYNNLGRALELQGRAEEAIPFYEAAIAVNGRYVEAYFNRGNAFKALKKFPEAETSYQQALELQPDHAGTLKNLSNLLCALSRDEEARALLERRLLQTPDDPDTMAVLGQVAYRQGRLEEVKQYAERILAANPNHPLATQQMALVGWARGDAEAAVAWGRRCIAAAPNWVEAHSHLLFAMNYAFSVSPDEMFAEHVKWGQRFADPLTRAAAPHTNLPDPGRRLRIGYVSGDFRAHVVSIYFLPVIEAHDRSQVDVFCYSNAPRSDAITRRVQDRASHWRDIREMSDEEAAAVIRQDGIDVLIDLNGHTAHSRLLVFARKPAPVQALWLGYSNTTGMQAMDYRLADDLIAIRGESDRLSVEKLIRLPGLSFCYLPPDYCPVVNELPARKNGFVTFGSSNNPGKISDQALDVWCRILKRRPGSVLQLNFPSWRSPEARQNFLDRIGAYGIPPERVRLLYTDHNGNLASYHDVDIALDPFPHNGSTTTLEALWMGVPVLALEGNRWVSRLSTTMLRLMEMPEWATQTVEQYVEQAVALSGDLERLEQLRAGLRMKMATSPITDIAGFTRGLEEAYRKMWHNWCATQAAPEAQR